MLSTIRRWHRATVDRIAGWPALRGRAGAAAPWAHYERHARAAAATAERHAKARASAGERADRVHARSASAAGRIANRNPPRILKRYQAGIGRLAGPGQVRGQQERPGE
jgi:hypothetical protein